MEFLSADSPATVACAKVKQALAAKHLVDHRAGQNWRAQRAHLQRHRFTAKHSIGSMHPGARNVSPIDGGSDIKNASFLPFNPNVHIAGQQGHRKESMSKERVCFHCAHSTVVRQPVIPKKSLLLHKCIIPIAYFAVLMATKQYLSLSWAAGRLQNSLSTKWGERSMEYLCHVAKPVPC